MPKDYTDVVLMILDSKERLYDPIHLRNRGPTHLNGNEYPLNGNKYALDLNRAYRMKWTPWPKIIMRPGKRTIKFKTVNKKRVKYILIKKPWIPIKVYSTLKEFIRSKKIGLLIYQEPCDHQCSKCPDKDGSKCKTIPDKVLPLHVSQTQRTTGTVKT